MTTSVIPISDLRRYNERLRDGLADKLFFLDKVEAIETFVDFGCGDGAVLAECGRRNPEATLIGVDNCPRQRSHAALLAHYVFDKLPGITIVGRACLIFSSVLHELGTPDTMWAFLRDTLRGPWEYVAIRDFAWSRSVRETRGPWPAGTDQRSFLEHMLKYRYVEDAAREARETYLTWTAAGWLTRLRAIPEFNIVHFDHHSHPYTRKCAERDWGFDFPDRTHLTAVLERKH